MGGEELSNLYVLTILSSFPPLLLLLSLLSFSFLSSGIVNPFKSSDYLNTLAILVVAERYEWRRGGRIDAEKGCMDACDHAGSTVDGVERFLWHNQVSR